MVGLKIIFVLSAIFAYSESASILDNIDKCEFSDSACQKALYGGFIKVIAESGIPEMGIPVIDPYVIKDEEVVAMGLLKIGVPNGVVKGYKTCNTKEDVLDPDTLTTKVKLVCDHLTIEAQYNIQTTPTLAALIGGIKIHGDGNTKIDIENVEVDLDIPFAIKKFEDCELHGVLNRDDIIYTYKILGKVTLAIDNLYVGSQDISTVVVNIFNENWEFISRSFGRSVIDKGLDVFVTNVNKFFAMVPMKDLIKDDISSYVSI